MHQRCPRRYRALHVAAVAAIIVSACASGQVVRETSSGVAFGGAMSSLARAGLNEQLGGQLDSLITAAIANGVTPGASVAVGRNGEIAFLRGYGRTDWNVANSAPVDAHTLFDMASLTKVVATTTIAMILEGRGELDLNRTVASYLPAFNSAEKSAITLRQLVTHSGGLEAFAALFREHRGRAAYLTQINARPLAAPPGTRTVYSDWDMILLQLVMEQVTGETLDQLTRKLIFGPLGMNATMFNPRGEVALERIVATEIDTTRGGLMHGVVHDENAWALGGVAGHAGLFSTAHDLTRFAQMMLNGGELDSTRVLNPMSITRWTAVQSPGSSRALGWDTPSRGSSAGRFFSPWSFGHTGFTGTSIWIDPAKDLYVILLTSRVNPSRAQTGHTALRRAVADAVQRAVVGARLIDWERR